MKLGLVSAIADTMGYEEMIDLVAQAGLECEGHRDLLSGILSEHHGCRSGQAHRSRRTPQEADLRIG